MFCVSDAILVQCFGINDFFRDNMSMAELTFDGIETDTVCIHLKRCLCPVPPVLNRLSITVQQPPHERKDSELYSKRQFLRNVAPFVFLTNVASIPKDGVWLTYRTFVRGLVWMMFALSVVDICLSYTTFGIGWCSFCFLIAFAESVWPHFMYIEKCWNGLWSTVMSRPNEHFDIELKLVGWVAWCMLGITVTIITVGWIFPAANHARDPYSILRVVIYCVAVIPWSAFIVCSSCMIYITCRALHTSLAACILVSKSLYEQATVAVPTVRSRNDSRLAPPTPPNAKEDHTPRSRPPSLSIRGPPLFDIVSIHQLYDTSIRQLRSVIVCFNAFHVLSVVVCILMITTSIHQFARYGPTTFSEWVQDLFLITVGVLGLVCTAAVPLAITSYGHEFREMSNALFATSGWTLEMKNVHDVVQSPYLSVPFVYSIFGIPVTRLACFCVCVVSALIVLVIELLVRNT